VHPLAKIALTKSRPINKAAGQEFKYAQTLQQKRKAKQKREEAVRAEEYVVCKYCGAPVMRRNLKKHEYQSYIQVVRCAGCKAIIKKKNIEKHREKCLKISSLIKNT